MEIEQVAEMARTVAALPQAERDYFDGMVADQRAKAAEDKRVAKLRGMSDLDAISAALDEGVTMRHRAHRPGNIGVEVNPHKVQVVLRDPGFVRLTDSDEGAVELACRLMRNSPRVRMLMGAEAAGALCGELATRDAVVSEEGHDWRVAFARQAFEKAYSEAGQTHLAADWMQAALLGRELVDALDGRQ